MNDPVISVILPVYNGEKFLASAIQSILDQTFTDFELIIINDGSVDKTENIIRTFADPRIVYLKNDVNKGLVYCLNRGIEFAKGQYLARMDADDVCFPERLMKQKSYLDKNADTAAVASTVLFINNQDEPAGDWTLDRETITSSQIRKKIIWENCIAHPTIVIRSGIAKKLMYKPYQENIEDYDLWLRILNRGYKIVKLDEPQLNYRVHGDSVTGKYLRKSNPFFKHAKMKSKFLIREILSGNINEFTFRVMATAIIDFLKGIGKGIKNLFR